MSWVQPGEDAKLVFKWLIKVMENASRCSSGMILC